MQGKAKTILLLVVLVILIGVTAYMYLGGEKPDTTIPTGPAIDATPAAPNGRPARPADEPPAEPPARGGSMSG